MFEKKYKLALVSTCFFGIFHTLNSNPVKIMMPLVPVKNKIFNSKPKELDRTIRKIKLSSNKSSKLPFEEHIDPIIEIISPCVREILFISYSSHLSTIGDKIKDIFPLNVSLSFEDTLSSYKEDIKDLQDAYKNDPFVIRDPNFEPAMKYLDSPFHRPTTNRLCNLASFKNKYTFHVGYKGPILMQSIHNSINSLNSDRRTKMKEALESIVKISDTTCELYSYSRIVSHRRNQVLNLEKNLKNTKIRESAGSATVLDLMEARDSLEEYKIKLNMDLDNFNSLKKRCSAFGVDTDKIIQHFSSIPEDFYTKQIDKDIFENKLRRSLKAISAMDVYKTCRLESFSSVVSSFAPNLDVSANFFSNGHREFKFGITTEGIKLGQFLKYIGQKGYSESKYNYTMRLLYSETYEMFLLHNSRIRKNLNFHNVLKTIIENRKLMESILNDAASIDSTKRPKVSEADVLKSKLSEDDHRIKMIELKMEILKSALQMTINLSDENDFGKLFNRYAGKSKKISIDELEKNFYYENEIKINDFAKNIHNQLINNSFSIESQTKEKEIKLNKQVTDKFNKKITDVLSRKRKDSPKRFTRLTRRMASKSVNSIPSIMHPLKGK